MLIQFKFPFCLAYQVLNSTGISTADLSFKKGKWRKEKKGHGNLITQCSMRHANECYVWVCFCHDWVRPQCSVSRTISVPQKSSLIYLQTDIFPFPNTAKLPAFKINAAKGCVPAFSSYPCVHVLRNNSFNVWLRDCMVFAELPQHLQCSGVVSSEVRVVLLRLCRNSVVEPFKSV